MAPGREGLRRDDSMLEGTIRPLWEAEVVHSSTARPSESRPSLSSQLKSLNSAARLERDF